MGKSVISYQLSVTSDQLISKLNRPQTEAWGYTYRAYQSWAKLSAFSEINGIKNALLKDGWVITDDPFTLEYKGLRLYADLGAEKLLAAEKMQQKIVIEIKVFIPFIYKDAPNWARADGLRFSSRSQCVAGEPRRCSNCRPAFQAEGDLAQLHTNNGINSPSLITELEKTLGQYSIYLSFLRRVNPERKLYLAITETVYTDFFLKPAIQDILSNQQINYLIFDPNQQVISSPLK